MENPFKKIFSKKQKPPEVAGSTKDTEQSPRDYRNELVPGSRYTRAEVWQQFANLDPSTATVEELTPIIADILRSTEIVGPDATDEEAIRAMENKVRQLRNGKE